MVQLLTQQLYMQFSDVTTPQFVARSLPPPRSLDRGEDHEWWVVKATEN